MPTLPNGVDIPAGGDLVNMATMLGRTADGFSNAIGGLGTGKRQPRLYRVADQGEKNLLAGDTELVFGDRALVLDTLWYERWTGTAWRITRTIRPYSFPMAAAGIIVGSGASTFVCSINDDTVHVRGVFTFGSGSSWSGTGGMRFILPVQAAFPATGTVRRLVIGTVVGRRGGTAAEFSGPVVLRPTVGGGLASFLTEPFLDANVFGATTSTRSLIVTGGTSSPTVGYAAGDQISLDLRYRRA